ncbi:MAG: SUMF1/EgtB/PvdO family nonheme iron enzyme [Acidobacteriota bacterium]|nr:SUMF1/EgtB/PvdO family nonheme iron enzyme [Acidobacteriota bacterium]
MAKIGDKIGPYTLEKFLGSGGFGEVWLADNPQDLLYQKVAIKLAKSEDITLDMIKSEARLWRSVSGNENIIPFIEAKNYDGQIVIVSEFADDGSLQDYLNKNGGKIGILESESILQDILKGLEHLHNKGIGHFDLKPANILIKDGKFCLADFGLSKILVTENTSKGAGTLSYSSPELFNRKRSLQSDIWSVGVILQKMLTGRMPFEGDSEHSLMFSIIQDKPKPLPNEIPQLYQNLISKCLQKDTKDRFQSAGKMREALKSLKRFLAENTKKVEDSETIDDVDFDKTEPLEIRVAQNWREIEVEKQRQHEEKQTRLEQEGLQREKVEQQRLEKERIQQDKTFTNSIGMEFVKIPSGSFMMGSDIIYRDENPIHKVAISQDFWLQRTVVTQAQWQAVMGNNPSRFKGDNLPVETVSWDDAQEFIKKLNAKGEGTYRLPTEAEWEYAARAGTTGDYAGNLDSMAWYSANSGSKTHEVGTKQTNGWRLYDMHGNVWEWCANWYGEYPSGAVTNPAGATTGSNRVYRGGSFINGAVNLRSAIRYHNSPSLRNPYLGFRVVRN